MKRINNTERLGIINTDLIVTDELGWIFREQPLMDVGIDAILEQAENEEPTGKFIAVQIKSGRSHFHFDKSSLTYYPSQIHYNYWINLNIPIILVAYLPEENECYWQVINKKTVKKTKKRWKIKIPKKNQLKNSKDKLSKLVLKIDTFDIFSKIYEQDFDLTEAHNFMYESNVSINNITNLMSEEDRLLKDFRKKYSKLIKTLPVTDKSVTSYVKNASRGLVIQSNRIIFEISLFSKIFSKEIFMIEKLIYAHKIYKVEINQNLKNSLVILDTQFQKGIMSIEQQKSLPDSITESAISLYPNQRELKESLTERITLMIEEFTAAHGVIVKLLNLCD